jgi:hypothetical protein
VNYSIQTILHGIELGKAQILTRLTPFFVGLMIVAALYDFGPFAVPPFVSVGGVFRGLNDAQSMDNAQLARQIVRGQGFTTKFVRPYALIQLRNFATTRGLDTGQLGELFPPDRFPKGTQRVLPDTYNAPGYPYLLAGWFGLVKPQFDESNTEIKNHQMYAPDRFIPVLNQILLFLTAGLVFGLGLRHFDDRVAWVALISFVVTGLVWEFSVTGLSTSLLMFLMTGAIFCALEIYAVGEACLEDPDHPFLMAWVWALLLGVLFAAACLTRLSLLCLLLPLLILLSRMPRASYSLVFLVALIVLGAVCPWFWHLYKVSGNPFGSAMTALIYGQDNFTGDQIYRGTSIPGYESLLGDALGKEFTGLRWHLEHAWELLGYNPLIVFFAVSVLHRFKRPKVLALQWFLVGSTALIIAVISLGVNKPQALDQLNTVAVLFPCLLVVGSAFFFLMLDRLELQAWQLNSLVALGLLFINAIPMALTLTNPSPQPYCFPPYLPPAIRVIAQFAQPEEWATSDMPWASAWYADQASLWLPDSIKDFDMIHDSICPTGVLFLTPVTWSKPVDNLNIGEDKDWLPLYWQASNVPVPLTLDFSLLPKNFPLREQTATPPGGPEYSIWSDRPRWKN